MKLNQILFLLCVILLTSTCKRDEPIYSNDTNDIANIPDWLRNVIINRNKSEKSQKYSCKPPAGRSVILEQKNNHNDSIVYEFSGICSPCDFSFYFYDGHVYFYYADGGQYNSVKEKQQKANYTYLRKNYTESRSIWVSKCK